MKKPQLLKLIQRSTRFTPSIYRFGANETLNVYHDGHVDICDAQTGYVVRKINYDWLRDWGYSPAKLLAGDEEDQFINDGPKTPISEHLTNALRGIGFTTLLTGFLIVAGNITGCTDYLFTQLDKDIATTTKYPVDAYYEQIEFKQANEHANNFLAKKRN